MQMAEKIISTFSAQYGLLKRLLLNYDETSRHLMCLASETCLVIFDENDKEKHIITYPSTVMDICVDCSDSSNQCLTWWTLTEDDIWRSTVSDDNSVQPEQMDTEDVFRDLLHDQDLFEMPNSSLTELNPVTPPGRRMASGMIGAKCLAAWGSILVVLIQKTSDWLLSFYSVQKGDNEINVEEQRNVKVANVSTLCDSSREVEEELSHLPQLYVIVSESVTKSYIRNNKAILVCNHLFAYMFGSEACLLSLPICLVTSYCGILYGIPFSLSHSGPASVVMDVGEPVVAIHALTVKLKRIQGDLKVVVSSTKSECLDSAAANCLLTIGRHGRIHLLLSVQSAMSNSATQVIQHDVNVPGIVQCADISGNLLVHSTGRDVFVTDLTPLFYNLLEHSTDGSVRTVLKNQPQSLCNVKKISVGYVQNTTNELKSNIPCLALTAKGRLLRFIASGLESTPSGYMPGGSTIKDALSGISRVANLFEDIQSKLREQDEILHQLQIASLILSATKQEKARHEHSHNLPNILLSGAECPMSVSWCVKATDPRSGIMTCRLILRVLAVGTCLGCGWCISVSFIQNDSEAGKNTSIYSKIASISHLSLGKYKDVNIDLGEVLCGDRSLPLTISAQILYGIQETISTEDTRQTKEDSHVFIPLPHITLDVLHFLEPIIDGSDEKCVQHNEPDDLLENIAKSRCCFKSDVPSRINDHELHGLGFCTRNVTVKKKQADLLGIKSDLDLMKWLFRETDKCISQTTIEFNSLDNHGGIISVLSPDDDSHEIRLQVQNVPLMFQIEASIKNRLQMIGDAPHALSLSEAKVTLAKIQSLLMDVTCLQDDQVSNSHKTQIKGILTVYKKLKDLRF